MKPGDLVKWRDDQCPRTTRIDLIGIITKELRPGWMKVHWLSGVPSYSALVWSPCTKEPVMHLDLLSEHR